MKLGVISTTEVNNSYYRAVFPAEAMKRAGHAVEMVVHTGSAPIRLAPLLDCDVVHLFRRCDPHVFKCVDTLRARGVGITYDNDDDIRLTPKESANHQRLGGAKGHREYQLQIRMMRRVDVVTTTTTHLAERFGADHDRPVHVIPNYLGDQQFERGPRNDRGLVVGWVAGKEHVADASRLRIGETLRRVMDRRPDVRVVTMGVRLDLDPARYTHHDYIPIHLLGAEVRKFDIGIAPLADIPMSYARSDIKVKEYSAVGVPWLASARGPYAALTQRCGGLLVADDGWEQALLSLTASRFKRAQLRRVAERWARSQRIDKHLDEWEAAWTTAASATRTGAAA
jgi:glycosyltransferase involved in cell wall biosynthesis